MIDIMPVTSSFVKDSTLADTIITVFNGSPGENVSDYKTRIPAIVLQPGVSRNSGLDVRVVDLTGCTRPQWEEEYRSDIGDISVWQNLSIGTKSPVQSIVLVGDNSPDFNSGIGGPIPEGFDSIDATDELSKILVTSLPKNVIYEIEA